MKTFRALTAVSLLSTGLMAFGATAQARETQPRDDRGGHRGAHTSYVHHRHATTSRESERGDDRGKHLRLRPSREIQSDDHAAG